MKVELGDKAKCKISGFTGIVTTVAKCLTGCDRVTLKAPMQKDGKMGEEYWFDIYAVEVIKKAVVKTENVSHEDVTKKGGPIERAASRHGLIR